MLNNTFWLIIRIRSISGFTSTSTPIGITTMSVLCHWYYLLLFLCFPIRYIIIYSNKLSIIMHFRLLLRNSLLLCLHVFSFDLHHLWLNHVRIYAVLTCVVRNRLNWLSGTLINIRTVVVLTLNVTLDSTFHQSSCGCQCVVW